MNIQTARAPEQVNVTDLFEAAFCADANGRPVEIGATVYRKRLGPDSEHGTVVQLDLPRVWVRWSQEWDVTRPLVFKLVQVERQ